MSDIQIEEFEGSVPFREEFVFADEDGGDWAFELRDFEPLD